MLRAFARSLARDPAAADDLTQEALLKAWNARESFEPGTNLKAWAFLILRNVFYSEKRRSWRQASWDEEKAERTLVAPSDAAATMQLDELRRALRLLPPGQRDALVLVGAVGFAYEEAAEICGCAVGTIKSRVNRGRRALEEILSRGAIDSRNPEDNATDAMDAILEYARQIADAPAAG